MTQKKGVLINHLTNKGNYSYKYFKNFEILKIIFIYINIFSSERFKFEKSLLEEINEKVKAEFPNKPHQKILENIEEIFQYKYRHLLSVFELNVNKQSSDLDEAILNSFTKSIEKANMIQLCMYWGRVDIARKIFEDQNSEKVGFQGLFTLQEKFPFILNSLFIFILNYEAKKSFT